VTKYIIEPARINDRKAYFIIRVTKTGTYLKTFTYSLWFAKILLILFRIGLLQTRHWKKNINK